MRMRGVTGLHHVTAIAGPAQQNLDFYAGVYGLPTNPQMPSRRLWPSSLFSLGGAAVVGLLGLLSFRRDRMARPAEQSSDQSADQSPDRADDQQHG